MMSGARGWYVSNLVVGVCIGDFLPGTSGYSCCCGRMNGMEGGREGGRERAVILYLFVEGSEDIASVGE